MKGVTPSRCCFHVMSHSRTTVLFSLSLARWYSEFITIQQRGLTVQSWPRTIAPIHSKETAKVAMQNQLAANFLLITFAQLIRTFSKFHCLLQVLHPTKDHSSQEHIIDVLPSSCFLSITTGHLSNLISLNLIKSLSLLAVHFLLSSFVGALHKPQWPLLNLTR